MFVNDVNEVKIYNLSAGKTLPEWLTDRRKRSKLANKVDSRRHIELIQDFEMPTISTSIRISPDQQFILATGTYKPRVKCYEVSNLSLKFERCFDSEVTTFEFLSEDYRKMVFLQYDRFLEIHAAAGRHYRLRIPRFGRDMKYHAPLCDLFIVGTTRDVYRLNLERGQFLQPYETDASCINACDVNMEHHLFVVGSKEGTVEAWDPRSRSRCATLNVAVELPGTKRFPSVSALKFKNGLQMGVGTASGHVLLYDIRSRQPMLVKDHLNKVPIKRITFNKAHSTVYSMDEAILKLWDENTGKQVAYIESTTSFNDFCAIVDTGLLFIAQEDIKMLTYYVPAIGPAPRWCSFLDNFTEEIESEIAENIYDDYQFVTQKQLEELGLETLIGTNLLNSYMHGYFMDVRLYSKAKAVVDPFAFERFRKEKARRAMESERKSRLQINSKLPDVNQDLALRIMDKQTILKTTMKSNRMPNLLEDNRFKAMFENPDFVINKNAEEYRVLAPAIKRLENLKVKELKQRVQVAHVNELHLDELKTCKERDNDADLFGFEKDANEPDFCGRAEESSDDENLKEFRREMKQAYKNVKRQRSGEVRSEDEVAQLDALTDLDVTQKSVNVLSLDTMDELNEQYAFVRHNIILNKRIQTEREFNGNVTSFNNTAGSRQMTFQVNKKITSEVKREFQMKTHLEERKNLVRPINSLKFKKKT